MLSFNYPNGEPQTPTRTPTATIFGDNAFQTPKLESSFFDPRVTWDTSDPYASSPELLRTPQRFTLGNPPKLSDTPVGRNAGDVPNVRSAKLSRQTDPAKRIRSSRTNGGLAEDGPRTVESAKSAASMQTPPPSSASRNKVSEFETMNHSRKRLSMPNGPEEHLETPSRLMGASPGLFANFQSSPDLFQLGSMEAAASPSFPQQRLFWDNDPGPQGGNMDLPEPNFDLFGSNMPDTLNANNNNATMQDLPIPQLPAIDGPLDLPEINHNRFGYSSGADAALFPAPFSTSPRLPTTKAEDPAMFLSSPARRFGGPQPTPEKRPFSRPRQPYHHQTEESKREQLRRSQGPGGQVLGSYLEDDEDDDFTPRQRPGLTRSLTHTAVTRPQRLGLSSPGMMPSTSKIRKSPSKGRSSPVKALRPQLSRANSVAAGMPTRSQSLVLKIGKDGRAKTEMQTVIESPTGLTDPITGMELDGSTTESECDSAEYSEYPVMNSRNPSSTFSESGLPFDRSDHGSRPNSKGSYVSAIASSHSGRLSPWDGSSRGGVRPQYKPSPSKTPKRQSMLANPDLTYGSVSSASEALPDNDEDTGDAQHALRQVLQQRRRSKPYTFGYGSQPPRPVSSSTHFRSSPPRLGQLDLHSREANTSPTTMTDPDLATPITDRYSNPSNGTRCICNSMDNGGHLMIQWYVSHNLPSSTSSDSLSESCNHWLHTKCVGLERSNLPSVYVCMFCAQTPSRRSRVRGPVPRPGLGHVPTSPLAHKSYRFR